MAQKTADHDNNARKRRAGRGGVSEDESVACVGCIDTGVDYSRELSVEIGLGDSDGVSWARPGRVDTSNRRGVEQAGDVLSSGRGWQGVVEKYSLRNLSEEEPRNDCIPRRMSSDRERPVFFLYFCPRPQQHRPQLRQHAAPVRLEARSRKRRGGRVFACSSSGPEELGVPREKEKKTNSKHLFFLVVHAVVTFFVMAVGFLELEVRVVTLQERELKALLFSGDLGGSVGVVRGDVFSRGEREMLFAFKRFGEDVK